MQLKLTISLCIIVISSMFSLSFVIKSPINEACTYNPTKKTDLKELTINWNKNIKLKQSDFKAPRKYTTGFAVATTASAFGYNITDNNGEITGSIYVRFYPEKSWWNPDYQDSEVRSDVLEHEQLHFDICELYGRKLYKEIISLRDLGKLDEKHMNSLYGRIEKQYSDFQDDYDEETNHSINRTEQAKWNKLIEKELKQLSAFSNYNRF